MSHSRIGVIKFINSIPLRHGMERFGEVIQGTPRGLASAFEKGELDVSYIPSVEYLRNRDDYCLVPGVSISSFGTTRSVRLYYSGDIGDVGCVCLSPDSLTSNFLFARVLDERYGISPKYVDGNECKLSDARVIIGDRALVERQGLNHLDLGTEWMSLTGLPLVYAVCVARDPQLAEELAPGFQQQVASNLRDLKTILSLSGQSEYRYYIETLDYRLNDLHSRCLDRIASYLDSPA